MVFAKEVANAVSTPAWKMITPPWELEEKKE
jgi:nitrogenase molybdenum-iron protein alpha chain